MTDDPARNGPGPGPGYRDKPRHMVRYEPSPKRMRATFADTPVFDTTRALILFETNHVPVYYVPCDDIAMELLTATAHVTWCPFKGEASYWSVNAGNKVAENAVWGYRQPYDEVADLSDYMAFYWNRLDHWYEEDEEVFVHARRLYVRVDILPSSRSVRVVLGGVEVANSTRARFLFETGLPVRYYLPREDVRMDLLVPSDSVTRCPYKGTASYFSAGIDGARFDDIVWTYREPVAESERIRDLLCFYNEKVDAIFVDGTEQEKPVTKWS
ncbi:MAG: DUF427 domain-containing protein [Alphaproteobacteria bacterium]|jgi:uncharacterized protein (DUF427 family)